MVIVLCTQISEVQSQSTSYIEKGKASYYADKFHGRITANGEIFSSKKYTAAHRTLPFGSKVLVTDNQTGKSVIVRINDRGPFIKGRIIDLSYASAADLGIIHQGVGNVTIRVLSKRVIENLPYLKPKDLVELKN